MSSISAFISSSLIMRTIPFYNTNLFFIPKSQSLCVFLNNRTTTNRLIFAKYPDKAPPEIPNVPKTEPPPLTKENPVVPTRGPEIDPTVIPPEIVVDPRPPNPNPMPDAPKPPLSPPGPETPLPPRPPDVVPPRPPGPEIVPPPTFPPDITPPTAPGIGPTIIV